jgi:hypothetical protein
MVVSVGRAGATVGRGVRRDLRPWRPERPKAYPTRNRSERVMRTSTIVVLIGVALFLLPIPGTFVLGALVVLAGLVARLFGL